MTNWQLASESIGSCTSSKGAIGSVTISGPGDVRLRLHGVVANDVGVGGLREDLSLVHVVAMGVSVVVVVANSILEAIVLSPALGRDSGGEDGAREVFH